jgi:hypothetical protein
MIIEDVYSLILHKKVNGLADVELYGSEEHEEKMPYPRRRRLASDKYNLTVPPKPKQLAKFNNLTDVTLKNIKEVETIMISPDIEVTFERPVTCVAERDEVYSNSPITRPILASISNPMGLICGIPPE